MRHVLPGWSVAADFRQGLLYDVPRATSLTASAAVGWGATAYGVAFDFSAAGSSCQIDTAAYAPPAQYTILALVQIGTVQKECILTWVGSDPGEYDHLLELTAAGVINWYTFPYGRIGSSTTATSGALLFIAITYDGTNQTLYINGKQEAQNGTATGGYTGYASPKIRLGYKAGDGSYASGTHKTLMFAVAPFALSGGQVFDLAQRPFSVFTPRSRRMVDLAVGTAAAAYNETLSDAITAGDSAAAVLAAIGSLSDAITAADSLAAALGAVASLNEAATAADDLASALAAVASATDAATAADAAGAALAALAALSEALAAADAAAIAGLPAPAARTVTAILRARNVVAREETRTVTAQE